MKLVFIDETGDSKCLEYFGLSCVVIDSSFYRKVKEEFQQILVGGGWRKDIEFKGSYLFSASKGDIDIEVEKRIEIAEKILKLNAKKNSRMKFYYVSKNNSGKQKDDYLSLLPQLLDKALQRAQKKQGKDVLCLHYDQRKDISPREVYDSVVSVVKKKGYILLENVSSSGSCYHTVGILYADLVGYLLARVETISSDSELFENIPPEEWENNGKIRKYKSSKDLLKLIKSLNVFEIKE
ncbi:hypothetical protein KAR34_00470 [bacterium]|nr:hypothetical protein [bacterium]